MTERERAPNSNAENPMTVWLRERLTGPQGRKDWDRLVEASWNQIVETPVRTLMPPEQVQALVEVYLQADRMEELVRPVVETILPRVIQAHREDSAPIGRWVPDSARGAIERMVSRPGMVHEEWLRALFKQRVVEAVMADALYRGIRDFSTIMPRLVLSLMPTGRFAKLGGAGAIGKRVVEELERRIEPEIKTFLKGGTKRALLRAADFAVDHRDDSAALAFRKNVVQFVLSKSPQFHLHAVTDDVLEDLGPIARQVAKHVAAREETRTLVKQAITEVDRDYGDKAVGEVLREIGIDSSPDLKAWASATWPGVLQCIEAPGVRDWMDELVVELLEAHDQQRSTQS